MTISIVPSWHCHVSGLALALIVPAAVLAQPPSRDVAKPATGTAAVVGTVTTDDRDPQPLRRVRVGLISADRAVARTVISDDAGVFRFTALPAGRFTLSGTKAGYVAMAYGARRPNRPGLAIVLADGQRMMNVTLRLPRGSVIAGTLTDQNGEPFAGATVRAMRYAFGPNQRTLLPTGTQATTDDRGRYRIFGLPAGEYAVSASMGFAGRPDSDIFRVTDADVKRALAEVESGSTRPGTAGSQPASPRARTVGYASIFYPGTSVAAQATLVKLGVGEERPGIDFQMSLVATARIDGVVSAPDGVNPQTIVVQMIDSNPAGFLLETFRRATVTDGAFSLSGVAPGQYTITARGAPGAPTAGAAGTRARLPQPTLWAKADVTVDGQDLSGVSLTLQPGLTVAGRLQFEGSAHVPPDLARVRVNLAPVQTPGEVSLGATTTQVEASGAFSLGGVTPGRYRLTASIPSPRPDTAAWMLKTSTINGRDALDVPVEVAESTDSGLVIFTDRLTELTGTVQDASGQPAPEYQVVVFASDKTHWTMMSRRIQSVRPSTDGKYIVRNLPPGDYLLTAVTDIEPGEWYDPSLLEQLVRGAVKVTIADGEKKTQDLRLAGGG